MESCLAKEKGCCSIDSIMAHWYAKVSLDIANLPACIDHFYNELNQAKVEVKLRGNVEKAASELPAL